MTLLSRRDQFDVFSQTFYGTERQEIQGNTNEIFIEVREIFEVIRSKQKSTAACITV